jgi:hypothetical protein
MNKKSLLLIEIIWIILGLMCLGIAIRETVNNGIGRAWLFLRYDCRCLCSGMAS